MRAVSFYLYSLVLKNIIFTQPQYPTLLQFPLYPNPICDSELVHDGEQIENGTIIWCRFLFAEASEPTAWLACRVRRPLSLSQRVRPTGGRSEMRKVYRPCNGRDPCLFNIPFP